MPRLVLLAALFVGSLVPLACSATHGLEAEPPDGVDASDAFARDASVLMRPDAWTSLDACVTPLGPARWVPASNGECLGLAEPGCVTCHARDGGFDIRPIGTAPPPSVTPLAPGACGLCDR
ncbi:MAG: hypothetical protein J0L92_08010 [Deltaproteobacteria bacterium]|nr:hypothetical protein [Deltaproteobacteria bacterium]